MKTRFGIFWVTILVAGAGGLLFALITVAATSKAEPKTSPDKHGVRLLMGHNKKEELHVTEDSFKKALTNCAEVSYKVHFKPKSGTEWDKGTLDPKLFSGSEISVPPKDTGGPTPAVIPGGAGGVHATQCVSFGDTDDLKAFVNELVNEDL